MDGKSAHRCGTAPRIAGRAQVEIRIGINSGLVVVGKIGDDLRVDYTAFGDTTVLAARLQAAAACSRAASTVVSPNAV